MKSTQSEALNVKALNVKALNAKALNVKALNVKALNVKALNVKALNVKALSPTFSVTSVSQLSALSKVSGLDRSKTIKAPCAYL